MSGSEILGIYNMLKKNEIDYNIKEKMILVFSV